MAAGDDGSPKVTPQQTPVRIPKHDRTGGPMSGGMVDHNQWARGTIKANNAERLVDAQPQDRAKPGSEPTRPQAQPQAEPKTLRKFEDRQPDAPGQTQAQAPTRPSVRADTRSPGHYRELKKFEDRHPPGNDIGRPR